MKAKTVLENYAIRVVTLFAWISGIMLIAVAFTIPTGEDVLYIDNTSYDFGDDAVKTVPYEALIDGAEYEFDISVSTDTASSSYNDAQTRDFEITVDADGISEKITVSVGQTGDTLGEIDKSKRDFERFLTLVLGTSLVLFTVIGFTAMRLYKCDPDWR